MPFLGRRKPQAGGLDPALLGFLVDGDRGKAVEARRAAGLGVLLLFQYEKLLPLWHRHQAEVEAEAKKLGRRPWAVYLDESNLLRQAEQTPKEPLRTWQKRLRAEDEEP